MKKILLLFSLFLVFSAQKTQAQLRINVNIGLQPLWGPVGYDYVDYYYLPDMDVYYDVPRGMFVYLDDGRWVFAAHLPPRYGHYDLYRSYKVVINRRNPWMDDDYYRDHYRGYRGRFQPVIRDSHDDRYFRDRRPEYREYHRDDDHRDYHDNGRHEGHDRGEHRGRGRGRGDDD
ncbi:MAG: hypothetical protein KGM98_13915 [Bacteroidota bacterium]|nr:hypothetical protein [Bacteroidota bacterium]